jgi:uncharacterized membrane protein YphA (DoxX/SURF4 family)
METLARWLKSPLLALALRLYLGGLFIYASMYKINYAAEFAATIASYQLVPFVLVNVTAVVVPWIELACGLMLVAGLRLRSALTVVAGLLAVFTVAIVVNLVRGAPISCGCFHTVEDPISWWSVARDLSWLAMAGHVYLFDRYLHLDRMVLKPLKDIEA